MKALTAVFQALLDLSLTALPVIAAVLLARLCLRRAPKKYSYALWAVAGFRLLCPLSLPSPVSLFNSARVQSARTAARTAVRAWGQTVSAFPYIPPAAPAAGSAAGNAAASAAGSALAGASATPVPSGPSAMELLAVVWAAGLAVMLAWGLISWLRVYRDVRQGVALEPGVYQCDGLKTPFVLGLLRPKICVPFRMEAEELAHVLLHERTHLRRLDPWWKLLGFLILSLHWWNPAVWLCFFLFCRDMEMSCDEAVLRRMGPEVKQAYSLSLVRFAAGGRFPAAGPLAFGENDAKSRVKNILRWKRAAPAAAFLAAAVCLLAAAICGTDALSGRGWVQSEGAVSAGGRTELRFSYSVPKDINSCLFYTEVYDHGKLISQDKAACFDFSGEVNHAERKGTASLSGFINNGWQDGCWYFGDILSGAGLSVSFSIPQRSYLGCSGPGFPGDGARGPRLSLSELDAAAVLCLSDDDGKLSAANPLSQDFSPAGLFADGYTDVAAVLRVQFSRLSAEEFQAEFEKNGPGAGAAQDGNRVTLKSASGGANGSGGAGVDFRAELTKPVRSWAIYEDVYDRGVLISSLPRISDGFAEDGTGVTPRTFSGTLLCGVSGSGETGKQAFDGKLDCSYGETGSPAMAKWTVPLPSEEGYNGAGMIPGGAADGSGGAISLADVREAILMTYVFSDGPDVTAYSKGVDNIALANDAAVQFRLVTSVNPAENSVGSALRLYALKNPYVGDAAANGRLLKALKVEEELGGYAMELFTSNEPYTLQVDLKEEPGAAEHTAMVRDSFALLALIQNLDAVRWKYTLNGKPSSFALDAAAVNGVLERDGLPDIKTCGASAENLQALLNRLSTEDSALYGGDIQTPFAGILGYDGYIRKEPGAGGFFISHYIAQKDGLEFCAAESWGFDRDDHAVDLDGDGIKELVCNVTYGADGARRVLVYRLAADGGLEQADPLELLDVPHEDRGVGSFSEVYNAERGTVDLSFIPKGTDNWETKIFSLDMGKLTFLPFSCSQPFWQLSRKA